MDHHRDAGDIAIAVAVAGAFLSIPASASKSTTTAYWVIFLLSVSFSVGKRYVSVHPLDEGTDHDAVTDVCCWLTAGRFSLLFLRVRTIAKTNEWKVTESEANHETTSPSHSKEPEIKSIQIPDNGGISEQQQHAILRIYGPDQKGIVAAFAQLLHGHGCNILDSEQHASSNIFFQRICFDYSTMFTDRQTIEMGISDVCKRFGMQSGTYSFLCHGLNPE